MPLLLVNITAILLCPLAGSSLKDNPSHTPFHQGLWNLRGPSSRPVSTVYYRHTVHTHTHKQSVCLSVVFSQTHTKNKESLYSPNIETGSVSEKSDSTSVLIPFLNDPKLSTYTFKSIISVFMFLWCGFEFSFWTFCRWLYFCFSAIVAAATHTKMKNWFFVLMHRTILINSV